MIPRRFKQKNIVTHEGRTDGWTDRRVGRNSDVDVSGQALQSPVSMFQKYWPSEKSPDTLLV